MNGNPLHIYSCSTVKKKQVEMDQYKVHSYTHVYILYTCTSMIMMVKVTPVLINTKCGD